MIHGVSCMSLLGWNGISRPASSLLEPPCQSAAASSTTVPLLSHEANRPLGLRREERCLLFLFSLKGRSDSILFSVCLFPSCIYIEQRIRSKAPSHRISHCIMHPFSHFSFRRSPPNFVVKCPLSLYTFLMITAPHAHASKSKCGLFTRSVESVGPVLPVVYSITDDVT